MGKKRALKSSENWKRKKWYPILATSHFGDNTVVGETLAIEKEELLGKKIKQNLMNITGDMKKKDIYVSFEVVDVKEGKGVTDLVGYEMQPSTLKRMVRRGRDRLDDSLVFQTKDSRLVRIKPLLITGTNTNSSIHRKLRYHMQTYLQEAVRAREYNQFVEEVVAGKFQREMSAVLRKHFPLRTCEIRRFERIPSADKARVTPILVKAPLSLPKEPRTQQSEETTQEEADDQEVAQEQSA